MKIVVNGKNVEVTEAIRNYVEEKFTKVLNHYDQVQMIELTLNVVKNPSVSENHIAEVLCKLPSENIVLEEKAQSMYACIDLLSDKLLRQIQKHKDKYGMQKSNESIRKTSLEE